MRRIKKGPLRLEGINVYRSLSRGYPTEGAEIHVKVLASRSLPDGTIELVSLTADEPSESKVSGFIEFPFQTPEQHAARSAFMLMFDKFMAVVKANAAEAKKAKRSQKRKATK